MRTAPAIPNELIINTEDKSLVVTPDLQQSMPGISKAFHRADAAYVSNPHEYLEGLFESKFSFRHHQADVQCSLIPGNGNEMLVIWAPFSDSEPRSTAEDVCRYVTGESDDKSQAKPNTLSQIVKSSVTAEVLKALGSEMPVLTIFSVLPSRSYSPKEHWQLAHGDFAASAAILEHAVAEAQDRLHGKGSETQLDTLHGQGSSIGASNVIGATSGLLRRSDKFKVETVTAQELIMGPAGLAALALQFTVKNRIGGPGELIAGTDFEVIDRVAQPKLRALTDRAGNEQIGMASRMILGMTKLARNRGMTHPETSKTRQHVEYLLGEGIKTLVVLGEHSRLTHATPDFLPNGISKLIVRAEKGTDSDQYADHLIDEHVAGTVTATALNIH